MQIWILDGALLLLVGTSTFLIVWFLLGKPRPEIYIRFIREFVGVKVKHRSFEVLGEALWLPTFYATLFISSFSYMAVHTILRYPLLIDVLDLSVLQVGFIDAASQGVAMLLDYLLTRYVGKLTRAWTFGLSAISIALAYIIIIGRLLQSAQLQKASHITTISLVTIGQTLASLRLEDQEFQVMRNDAKEDMFEHAQEHAKEEAYKEWETASKIGAVLSSFQSLLRYPASLAATAVFSPMVKSNQIFEAYTWLGIVGTIFTGFLAITWIGHKDVRIQPVAERENSPLKSEPSKTDISHPMDIISTHWGILLEVGVLDATLQMIKSGFLRILQLTVLKSSLYHADLSTLMTLVFAVSLCFFWLSSPDDAGATAITGFALLGCGHFIMGVSAHVSSYRGMMISCLVFGLGQATSTGLRTGQKDRIRVMIREEGGSRQVERFIMLVSGGIVTTSLLLNSVLVGVIGEIFGMGTLAMTYAAIAFAGAWFSYLNRCRKEEACYRILQS